MKPAPAGLLLAALSLLGARRARAEAYAEHAWHAGIGVGYVALSRGDFSGPAIGVEGHVVYTLTDQFNLLAEASISPHNLSLPCASPPCAAAFAPYNFVLLTGAVGLTYSLDVSRWNLYGGLLVGGTRLSAGSGGFSAFAGADGHEQRLDLVPAAGVDYQFSRRWVLGLAGRYHLSPLNTDTPTTITQIYLRAEWTF